MCIRDRYKICSSAGPDIHISWSKYCLSVCRYLCLDVNKDGTNHSRSTQRLVIFQMYRPTNEPWSHAKTRSVWPTLRVKIVRRKKWAWIGILKPTEPHSPWEACSVLNTYCPSLLRGHLRRKLHHISVIRGSSRTPAKTHAQQFRFSWTIGVTPLPFNWMLTIRECVCVSRFLAHVILT